MTIDKENATMAFDVNSLTIGQANGIVCLGGTIIHIMVGTRYVTFEDHPRLGPIRCRRDGEVAGTQFSEKSAFWPVWEKWVDQGKRIDQHGRAMAVRLKEALEKL
jgi:hypothetical protein